MKQAKMVPAFSGSNRVGQQPLKSGTTAQVAIIF
jgi:hypothetical protein